MPTPSEIIKTRTGVGEQRPYDRKRAGVDKRRPYNWLWRAAASGSAAASGLIASSRD